MLREIIAQTLEVTVFVAVMMIAVEYLNVLTQGALLRILEGGRWRQYVMGVLLGATPGCLGSFAMVALYTHRGVSLGALTACMIATSGDEAFVMFAMFPQKALLMTAGMAVVGIAAGALTDLLAGKRLTTEYQELPVHPEDRCACFPRDQVLRQLRQPSAARGVLGLSVGLFVLALALGWLGPETWNWVRWTLLGTGLFGLFVVLTVPDHFLEEHLWRHTVLVHVPRIFAWTFGALLVVALVRRMLPAGGQITGGGPWLAMAAASLVGIIPESGPHLVFVMLYAKGIVPISTLVASSIVQDGHGMLPLLAQSRRDFVVVKTINLVVGLAAGAALVALGW